ncbi:LacI family DNA-binding transcriptional regulator [Alkalicoccus urumqiensis]|uniref:LacI family transcriptional regulator n=1 Tax=Alkalicoccus urumqiensis TaxID=1548213 RepID=A0A2P6MI35_ALKUR|nr:LacI family DNA-binding transcriptional regulator [Alkalicoccus urumqiensis]PRO65918.1 LacI family transcriptional regulator [Alkalicoccus urumqiensis]
MVTINDIARQAGVSRTTVSRVLNASGYVSHEARKAVEQVIKDTGYVPSEHAKSLRLKRTKAVGVIIPRISTETTSRIVDGISRAVEEAGYHILLANSNLQPEKEIEHMQFLESRRVDGIILLATNREARVTEALQNLKIPAAVVGQDFEDASSVIFKDYEAAGAVVRQLIAAGKTRIGFIGVDDSDEAVGRRRRLAYEDALHEAGITPEAAWVQTAGFDLPSGEKAAERMLQECVEVPDAVFAVTDRLAAGAQHVFQQRGYRIPEEVQIAGMGGTEIAAYMSPPLWTADYQYEEAGEEAVRLLMEQIQSGKKKVEKSRISYRLLNTDRLS